MPTAHSIFVNFENLLIKEFKEHLEKKGVSKVTSKNYVADIRNFLSRVPLSATHEAGDLNQYIAESSKTYSPATLKRKLSSIRTFCDWAFEKGYLNRKVSEISKPVAQVPDTPTLRPADLPIFRHPDNPSFPTPRISAPLKNQLKTTAAAVSGFGSVFVLLFIAKSIFGDALLFGPQARGLNQKTTEAGLPAQARLREQAGAPLLAATLSFGDLLAQTPTVLGASTQKTEQGTATLSAGSREIALYSPNLANNSRITVIPENSIEGAIFVARSSADSFTVAVDRPSPSDIPFTWEIVELQNTQ